MKMLLTGLLALLVPVFPSSESRDFYDEPLPVSLTIIAPLEQITEDRGLEEAGYHDVWILLSGAEGQDTLLGELRVRGNYRKRPENCLWPPLKLKVKKHQSGNTVLGDHRKFKLVTNCQGESYLMREYMIYRMYEQLSPYSFQVRLLDLTLRDMHGSQPDNHQLGFMIEHKDELAERLDLQVIESPEVTEEQLDLHHLARLKLFQYMIGNRDWGVYTAKNVELFSQAGQPLAIPYDFDFCGSVAVPYSNLGDYELRHWTDLCWDEALRETLRQEFLANIPAWKNMIQEAECLEMEDRRALLSYFRPFFRMAAHPERWAMAFPIECD